MAVVIKLERQRQQGFEPDDPVGRRAERQPLGILVPRRMVAGDCINGAVAQPLDDGAPVSFAAQRGRQLGEGPILADRGLVQREIGGRGIAGHRQPLRLGAPNRLDRGRGRQMGDVIARAGDLDEPKVALDHDDLGRRRDCRQAQPGGDLAFVDLARSGKARFFRMLHHQQVEAAGVGQYAAHDERIGDRLDPVGKAERAVGGEQAHFGQLTPP